MNGGSATTIGLSPPGSVPQPERMADERVRVTGPGHRQVAVCNPLIVLRQP
jgi:hypothetical protein